MSQLQQESAEQLAASVELPGAAPVSEGKPGKKSGKGHQQQADIPLRKISWRTRLGRDWQMLVMMVPGVLFLALFFYIPILGNVIAFQDYQPFLGISGSDWVGLQNFVDLYFNPDFWVALRNTIVLAVWQLVLFFPVPLGLALIVDSLVSNKLRRWFQSLVYLPHFLSWVLVIALFQQVLGGAGLVNNTMRDLGLDTIPFMTNPETFPLLATIQLVWKDAGWAMIIFLASLASIDGTLYEAAAADGAGRWRRRSLAAHVAHYAPGAALHHRPLADFAHRRHPQRWL